jgi:hypothetical protein
MPGRYVTDRVRIHCCTHVRAEIDSRLTTAKDKGCLLSMQLTLSGVAFLRTSLKTTTGRQQAAITPSARSYVAIAMEVLGYASLSERIFENTEIGQSLT